VLLDAWNNSFIKVDSPLLELLEHRLKVTMTSRIILAPTGLYYRHRITGQTDIERTVDKVDPSLGSAVLSLLLRHKPLGHSNMLSLRLVRTSA